MRYTMKLFRIGLKQIRKDGMLLVMIPAPILIGMFFKYAIPFLNTILTNRFSFPITDWYGLADGMLTCLTPMFVAMISAFLLLEEREEGISAFYQITPAEGNSYLAARIGLPMIWAFVMTIFVSVVFHISYVTFGVILLASILSSLTGIALAMMVVSLAGNRVEGLALSKLMGISFIGLILIWFIPAPYAYIMAILPSFWIGKMLMDGVDLFSCIFGVLSCFLWIIFFMRRLHRRFFL